MSVRLLKRLDEDVCDRFLATRPRGNVFQACGWMRAIHRSYGHSCYYIGCFQDKATVPGAEADEMSGGTRPREEPLLGAFPLVHLDHWLLGKSLVSMPYSDGGGVLGANELVEWNLVENAISLAEKLRVRSVEVRQFSALSWLETSGIAGGDGVATEIFHAGRIPWTVTTVSGVNKVRMVMDLPSCPDDLMAGFKAKLRSQIRKPLKEGLEVVTGGLEMLDEFYQVFAWNMRDLGSPVHSKEFIRHVMESFPSVAKLHTVRRRGIPMACSLTLGFNGVLANPWASSLRRYCHLAPNMLLYWSMLEYACENGYRTFDFGRSTVGSGTYRFKEQWGARPEPLYWYRFTRGDVKARALERDSGGMSAAVEIWKRLPVSVTKILGPRIRRHISL